jgi:hypothetical protein
MTHPLSLRLRWGAAALLLVTAVTHIPLVPEHLEEAPYVGALFIALSVVSVVFAGLLVFADTPAVWVASGLITLLAAIAFLASRTIGLPQIEDEIGNWNAPYALPALAAELLAAAAAAVVVHTHRTAHSPVRATS